MPPRPRCRTNMPWKTSLPRPSEYPSVRMCPIHRRSTRTFRAVLTSPVEEQTCVKPRTRALRRMLGGRTERTIRAGWNGAVARPILSSAMTKLFFHTSPKKFLFARTTSAPPPTLPDAIQNSPRRSRSIEAGERSPPSFLPDVLPPALRSAWSLRRAADGSGCAGRRNDDTARTRTKHRHERFEMWGCDKAVSSDVVGRW